MPETVLVVARQSLLRETFVEMLALCGCRTVAAMDGVQARDMLRNARFDVVLTSYILGHEDGGTLAKDIKQTSPDTAVIVAGTYFSEELLSDHTVVDFYLFKPFSILDLRDALASVINRPEKT